MNIKAITATVVLLAAAACTSGEDKILVLTERGGQHGPFTDAALEWLAQHGQENGYTITEINNTDPVTQEYLEGFDAIIQLDYPPFGWTEEAMKAFQKYMEDGKGGWVGFHHASLIGNFREGWPVWEWFRQFMGGITYQNYIAELTDGTMHVETPGHPVMKGVSPEVLIEDDEFYIFDRSPRGKVRVLATVDEDSYTAQTPVRMGDHPVVWTNEDIKGRNVYILMGHSPKLLQSEDFTKMFSNSILWSLER